MRDTGRGIGSITKGTVFAADLCDSESGSAIGIAQELTSRGSILGTSYGTGGPLYSKAME
uniref:Uncharacterized protein MANES_15G192700 n=1 Tax=Rhizophora mucronata TaxID=61149 RepID=A0A2P2M7V7_RHIMU